MLSQIHSTCCRQCRLCMGQPHLIIDTFCSSTQSPTTIQHTQLRKVCHVTTHMTHSKLVDTQGVLTVHSFRRMAFEDTIFLKEHILQARDTIHVIQQRCRYMIESTLSTGRGTCKVRFSFVVLFKSVVLILTMPRCYRNGSLTQRVRNKNKMTQK